MKLNHLSFLFICQEITIMKAPGEKLGISIRGGNKGHPGNPLDRNDEGIFISKVNDAGAAKRDGKTKSRTKNIRSKRTKHARG